MRTTKTIPVTVDCASEAEAAMAEEILKRYQFKSEGLIKIDTKLRKKDYLVTAATRDFIVAK